MKSYTEEQVRGLVEALEFYSFRNNYEKQAVVADIGGSDVPVDCPDKPAHHKANLEMSDHDCFMSGPMERYTESDIRSWGTPPVLKDDGAKAREALTSLQDILKEK